MTPSATTERANRFVAKHRAAADALGRRAADLVTEPDAFVASLTRGLSRLADPAYRDAHAWMAPGATGVIGVRGPLVQAVERPVARALRGASPAVSIYLADACSRHEACEVRLFALPCPCVGACREDPERTWQLMRRVARQASDWVSVDSLADVVARGVLAGALPLGGARAARLLDRTAGSGGWSARRSPSCPSAWRRRSAPRSWRDPR